MKRNIILTVACTLATVLAATIAQEPSSAQNAATANQDSANQQAAGPDFPAGLAQSSSLTTSSVPRWGTSNDERQIQDLARDLRTAESASDRKDAEEKLRVLLSEDYDARLEEYEQFVDDLEAKIKEMRTKLQRRRDAKSDMIDLRIQVLEAEADDLGWPSKMRSSNFPSLLRQTDNIGDTTLLNALTITRGQQNGKSGSVITIDTSSDSEMLVIGLGEKDGVAVGQTIEIYRGDKFLAKAVVSEVSSDQSMARVTTELRFGPINPGDSVRLSQ